MMTPERRAELRYRLEVSGEDFNHGIVHEMLNEIDRLNAEPDINAQLDSGTLTISYRDRFVPFISDLVVGTFIELQGINYCVMDLVDSKDDGQQYSVTIQKIFKGAKTPWTRIGELEAEIAKYRAVMGPVE